MTAAKSDSPTVEPVRYSDAAADPHHPDHGRWVVESLVDDEAQWYRDMGRPVPEEALRADWSAAKRTLDRKAREPKPPPVTRDRAPGEAAADMARERGMIYRKSPAVDPGATNTVAGHPEGCTCIRCKRERRIKTLLTKAPRTRRVEQEIRGRKHVRYVGDFEWCFPALAREIAQVYADYHHRRGDFGYCASEWDRARLVTRKFEDICDRSKPVLGDWT